MISQLDLRRAVGAALGIGGANWDGNQLELSQTDRERLSIGTVRYVLAYPEQFDREQVARATVLAQKENFGSLASLGAPDFLGNVATFLRAYAQVAGDVATGTAEVIGRAVRATGIDLGKVLTFAAVAAVVWFGAPYVLPKLVDRLRK